MLPAKRRHAAAAPERARLLDLATLALTFGNDAVKMRKYALLFLDTARDGIAEMEQAMALEDLGRLADLGHRSKSSALAVGAHAFAAICARRSKACAWAATCSRRAPALAALDRRWRRWLIKFQREFAASDAR